MSRMMPAVALATVAALTSACGISADGGPRDIPLDEQVELGASGAGSGEPVDAPAGGPVVYLLGDLISPSRAVLQPVARDVARSPADVLRALLAGPTAEDTQRGLRTAIPAETELLRARLVGDETLEVDLSDGIFGATGGEQVDAVAQLVYTATALDGVQRVRLLADGQERGWPREDGNLESGTLTRYTYPTYFPRSGPDLPPVPAPQPPD